MQALSYACMHQRRTCKSMDGYTYLYIFIHHSDPDPVMSPTASVACTTSSMPDEHLTGDEGDPVVAARGLTASTASARPGGGEGVPADATPGLTASMASARPATR